MTQMFDLRKYMTETVAAEMAEAIATAGGNEVFFVGFTDEDGVITEFAVMARGNSESVAAITSGCRPGDVVIHNHPSGTLLPSTPDNHIASQLGNEGIGFYIVNNEVTELYPVVEAMAVGQPKSIDEQALVDMLSAGGPLSAVMDGFESRPPQVLMLRKVVDAFQNSKIAMIEAGTGTGKTMAYLLPAIAWSRANKKRVVVSTNTINLQQQLTEKDIPLIEKFFPEPFRAVLVKGRNNYVCLRKLEEAVNAPAAFDFDGKEPVLRQLWEWANKTTDGSKTDLGASLPDETIWEHVQSESDTTLKSRCPHFSRCFYYKARRDAAAADILIANHHLVFADIAVRSQSKGASAAVLPDYRTLILDEAHNIENVVSQYFGVRVTRYGLMRLLGQITRLRRQKRKGVLHSLLAGLYEQRNRIEIDLFDEIVSLIEEKILPRVDKLHVQAEELFNRLYSWLVLQNKGKAGEIKLRLTAEVRGDAAWKELASDYRLFIRTIDDAVTDLEELLVELGKIKGAARKKLLPQTVMLKSKTERLNAAARGMNTVVLGRDEDTIRWLEAREGRNGIILRFCSAPLDPAPAIRSALFEAYPTVVMTSATLSIEKSFDFMSRRLGLHAIEEERKIFEQLPAPFAYDQQVLIGIPVDIPEPNQPNFEAKLQDYLLAAIRASRGRAFVLFTAHGLLNKMYAGLRQPLEQAGIVLYKQGIQNRHSLLQKFRGDTHSVLFGTDSFWEGVDVRGEALVQVIIPRLPFRVPSEPVIQARVEAIEKDGGNSFLEYTVPLAVLRFKQGFGRLIRTRTDYGVILILDKRVISKNYGRKFLASLPDCTVLTGDAQQVFAEISHFLQSKDTG